MFENGGAVGIILANNILQPLCYVWLVAWLLDWLVGLILVGISI